jgi:hypothetical protein
MQIAAVMNPGELGQLIVGMTDQVNALLPERMGQQNFSGQTRDGNRCFLKKLRPLPKRLAYG